MKKQVSIRDVAKEAGVSAATVSYILNETPNLSFTQETRDKVMAAVEKLNYVANQAAKTLGSSRVEGIAQSKLIGIIIPQTENKRKESPIQFANPFYGTFLSAVELVIRKSGYHLILSGTNPGQSYLEIVKSRTLDGVIILGAFPSGDAMEYKRYNVPVVLVIAMAVAKTSFIAFARMTVRVDIWPQSISWRRVTKILLLLQVNSKRMASTLNDIRAI